MNEELRTVRDFVEDLLTDGRSAKHIIIVARNSYWKTRVDEVKQAILNFSGKIPKKILLF